MIKVSPVNMITPPNAWAKSSDNFWTITSAIAVDIWGIITISDTLGNRPYVPSVGSSLQASFQRGDYIGSTTNMNISVTKTAVLDANFRALMKISLVSAEATNIISGTVVFTLTEGAVVKKWAQNWAIKKLNTSAGF